MKILILTFVTALVFGIASTSANAGGRDSTTLQCGVSIGGFRLAYSADSKSDRKEDRKKDETPLEAVGLLGSDASGIASAMRAKPKDVERRLPLTVTFARFGCSF